MVGVDVQRIRRTLGLTAGAQPPTEGGDERPPIDRDAAQPASSATCAASSSAT